jgi:hypothetical protein
MNLTTINLKCSGCADTGDGHCDRSTCPCLCHQIKHDRPCASCADLLDHDNQCECVCHEE